MSIKHIGFDTYGYLPAASLTINYQTLLSLTDDVDVLFIFNSLNEPVALKLPIRGGTVEAFYLPAGKSFALDCRTNAKRIAKGDISVKYTSSAPTTGEISVSVVR